MLCWKVLRLIFSCGVDFVGVVLLGLVMCDLGNLCVEIGGEFECVMFGLFGLVGDEGMCGCIVFEEYYFIVDCYSGYFFVEVNDELVYCDVVDQGMYGFVDEYFCVV